MIAEGWERFEERTFSVFEPIPLGVDEEGLRLLGAEDASAPEGTVKHEG